jgi:hypothetical protein
MGTVYVTNKADTEISIISQFDDCGITFTKSISGTIINLGWSDGLADGNASVVTFNITRVMV